MDLLNELLRLLWTRPAYQRLFLAFTVGLFLSCAARVAEAAPQAPELPSWTTGATR
jgi:hypothetical protein